MHPDSFSINVSAQALSQIVEHLGWKSFALLYEDEEGLARMQEFMKLATQSKVKAKYRQLPENGLYW